MVVRKKIFSVDNSATAEYIVVSPINEYIDENNSRIAKCKWSQKGIKSCHIMSFAMETYCKRSGTGFPCRKGPLIGTKKPTSLN